MRSLTVLVIVCCSLLWLVSASSPVIVVNGPQVQAKLVEGQTLTFLLNVSKTQSQAFYVAVSSTQSCTPGFSVYSPSGQLLQPPSINPLEGPATCDSLPGSFGVLNWLPSNAAGTYKILLNSTFQSCSINVWAQNSQLIEWNAMYSGKVTFVTGVAVNFIWNQTGSLPAFALRLATTTSAQGVLSGIVAAGGSQWTQGWWSLQQTPTYVPFDGIVVLQPGQRVLYPAGYWPQGPIITTVLPYGGNGCSVMPSTVEVVVLPITQLKQGGPSSTHVIAGSDIIFMSTYTLANTAILASVPRTTDAYLVLNWLSTAPNSTCTIAISSQAFSSYQTTTLSSSNPSVEIPAPITKTNYIWDVYAADLPSIDVNCTLSIKLVSA